MKRIAVLLITLIMVCNVAFVSAESSLRSIPGMSLEYALNALEEIVKLYDEDPNSFNADWINAIYSLFQYEKASCDTYQALWTIDKHLDQYNVIDESRTTKSIQQTLNSIHISYYTKWLDGEMSNEDFLDKIIPQIKINLEHDRSILDSLK